MQNTRTKLRWKLGICAATAVTLIVIYPQAHLWVTRGGEWNGSYVTLEFDEVDYSAYVNALISGRPRRSDPYTGRDDQPGAPQPETYFSIQFIPPYLLAIPARIFGLSASSVFIILAPVVAFASSLAIFWLIGMVTGDDRVAATGVLVVLCFGALAATPRAVRALLAFDAPFTHLPYLPFLRRYVPAVPFPLFFIFCAFVWRVLTNRDGRAANRSAVLAGFLFAILVFSYFYLWTAAVAWLLGLGLLWLLARPNGWRDDLRSLSVIGVIALAALLPYFILLGHRAPTTDAIMYLQLSHAPDLTRQTEALGALVLIVLALAAWRRLIDWKDRSMLFAAAFALMPFIVFNQQVLTGRILQPIHYEKLVANYSVLVAIVLAGMLLWRGLKDTVKIPGYVLILLAVAAFSWGMIETASITKQNAQISLLRDEQRPVAMRLAELARESASHQPPTRSVVFIKDPQFQSDCLPTDAPQPVLWAGHMHSFAGISIAEERERLYQYLYYMGVDERQFAELAPRPGYLRFALLRLAEIWSKPVEVRRAMAPEFFPNETRRYSDYIASFNRERAAHPTLSYAVIPTEEQHVASNLDRWYERDAGEQVGKFMLYRVKLRP